jgi:hypothetical protein
MKITEVKLRQIIRKQLIEVMGFQDFESLSQELSQLDIPERQRIDTYGQNLRGSSEQEFETNVDKLTGMLGSAPIDPNDQEAVLALILKALVRLR